MDSLKELFDDLPFDWHPTSWLGGIVSLIGLVILVESGFQVRLVGGIPPFMQGIWGGLLVLLVGVLLMTHGGTRAADWLKTVLTDIFG